MTPEELEIAEANALRAKLGLKPLRPWILCINFMSILLKKK